MILYHNTKNEYAENISTEGIKCDKGSEARNGVKEYEGNLVFATSQPGEGYGGCTVSFYIDDEEAQKYRDGNWYLIPRDIPSKDIVNIDYLVWDNGGNSYKISDVRELIKKFGKAKVYNVLTNHGTLVAPYNENNISDLLDVIDKQLNEGVTLKISKQILTEARLGNLMNKTQVQTPKLADRSDFVKTDYIGISKFGIFNFRTSSQTHPGNYWYQTLEIPDFEQKLDGQEITPDFMKKLLEYDDIKVYCDDPSFLYWALKFMAYNDDYGIEPENRAPKRNNVHLQGALCKHLLSVAELIRSGELYEQITKDTINWFKYKSGEAYSNFSKTRMLGDARNKKNRINWETYDSYMNDYFASKAGINKFLDDEDIKQSLKDEIERTAKTDPNMTLDDFIEEEFGVEGVQGLANDLQIDVDYVRKYFRDLGF